MDQCQHRNVMLAIQRCMDTVSCYTDVNKKKTRKPKLSQFEIFSLKYGSYGGVSTEKLKSAKLRAERKIALGAKLPERE